MFSFLSDPKIFNFVIMGLYVANAGRWAFNKNGYKH